MKVFFDTNVIIDALTNRPGSSSDSRDLIRLVAAGEIEGVVSAKQLTDIYYFVRKYCQTEEEKREIIGLILDTFEVLPTLKSDLKCCLDSPMSIFEDALIDEIAKVNCIPYVVTNDVKNFAKAKSVAISPSQLNTLISAR